MTNFVNLQYNIADISTYCACTTQTGHLIVENEKFFVIILVLIT